MNAPRRAARENGIVTSPRDRRVRMDDAHVLLTRRLGPVSLDSDIKACSHESSLVDRLWLIDKSGILLDPVFVHTFQQKMFRFVSFSTRFNLIQLKIASKAVVREIVGTLSVLLKELKTILINMCKNCMKTSFLAETVDIKKESIGCIRHFARN